MPTVDPVFAIILQNPDSPESKIYGALVRDDQMLTFYGGERKAPSNFVFATKQYPSASAAIHQAFSVLREKAHKKGYRRIVMEPHILTVPASTGDLNAVWMEVWKQWGESLAGVMPRSAQVFHLDGDVDTVVNAYVNARAPLQPSGVPGLVAPAQAVKDRAAPLPLDPHEIDGVILPDGSVYRPRELGGHPDVAVLRRLREHQIYARLHGPAGTGKTALAYAAFGDDLIPFQGHGDVTVAHFVGQYLPTPDGAFSWADGPLTRAMRQGRVLLVDEITRIPSEALGILFSAIDGRRTIVLDDRPDADLVHAADGFYVVATYNPEGIGVHALDEAITSRFAFPIEVNTDYRTAKAMGIGDKPLRLVNHIGSLNAQLEQNGEPLMWLPQMRELLAYKRLIEAGLGEATAVAALVGQCPNPDDVPHLIEIASRIFGFAVVPMRLGRQVS